MIGRRGLLSAVPALAVAAFPLPAIAEDPATKAARLAEELSDALNGFLWGTFRAVIEPSASSSICPVSFESLSEARRRSWLHRFLNTAPDNELAEYHANEATKALQRMHGGAWQLTVDYGFQFMTATGRWNYPSGVYRHFA